MELRHLRYIVAAADAGSFGGAARRLHVAPQALAAQVADVERELGVTLFTRTRRGVRPSTAGEAFVADARQVLRAAAAAATRARRAAAGPNGVGALAVASVELGFTSGLVPAAVRAYQEAARRTPPERDAPPAGAAAEPDVERAARPGPPPGPLQVRHLPSLAQWEALRDGTLDLGVVYTPPLDDPELEVAWLADDPLSTALVARAHPLAGGGAVSIRELAADALLLFPRAINPGYHDRLFTAFAGAKFVPPMVIEAPDGPPAWALVAQGVGWVLEPASYAANPPPGTAPLTLADFALPFGLWAVWRRGPTSPATAAFLRALRAGAPPQRVAPQHASPADVAAWAPRGRDTRSGARDAGSDPADVGRAHRAHDLNGGR